MQQQIAGEGRDVILARVGLRRWANFTLVHLPHQRESMVKAELGEGRLPLLSAIKRWRGFVKRGHSRRVSVSVMQRRRLYKMVVSWVQRVWEKQQSRLRIEEASER